jgi:hypothetical protein
VVRDGRRLDRIRWLAEPIQQAESIKADIVTELRE